MKDESQAALDLLRRARERISDPERWTREMYARDADGQPIDYRRVEACQWCAIGALAREGIDTPYFSRAGNALADAARSLFDCSSLTVNDIFGHAAVLQMYDAAIASLTTGTSEKP